MPKLVSIIMPTRSGSHESLRKAIQSIKETAGGNMEDVEILLRIDDDDPERLPLANELTDGCGTVVVGPRGSGYNDMGIFVNDLVRVADSRWCFLFDDDAYIEGDWYEQLAEFRCDPLHGPAVNAENYVLGASWYKNGATGGAPGLIMPTEFVKSLDHKNPVDQQWLDEVHRMGWVVVQLQGVSYFHCGRIRA